MVQSALRADTCSNTGRFIWEAEEASKNAENERNAGRWWSEYMKKAGYKTYMTGKWHVRANAEKCFDMVRNVRGGMPNQTPEGYNRPLPVKKIHGVLMIQNSVDFGKVERIGQR